MPRPQLPAGVGPGARRWARSRPWCTSRRSARPHHVAVRAVRHRPGGAGVDDRTRSPPGVSGRSRARFRSGGGDPSGAGVSRRRPESGWELAGDDEAAQRRELRAADFDERVVAPGARRIGVTRRPEVAATLALDRTPRRQRVPVDPAWKGIVMLFGSGLRSTVSNWSTSNARPIWLPATSSRMSSASR